MKHIFTLLLSLVVGVVAQSQSKSFPIDHRHHLELLGTAKDSLYQQIVDRYDQYIRENPLHVKVQLERCKFIQYAYYDEYEEYNPNEEAAEECARKLLSAFPENPEAMLYATNFLYGDTLYNYLVHLEGLAEFDSGAWKDFRWDIHQQLAYQYNYGEREDHDMVILYGLKAMASNDSLDLSAMVAESYQKQNNKELGVKIILEHFDSTNGAWELNRKAQLLLEFGESTKAMELFRLAALRDSVNENASLLAKAMIENGLIAEARDYLVKAYKTGGQWQEDEHLFDLLNYDIQYGTADSASATYRKFTASHFYNDPVGLYRLRMIAKAPLMGWTFGDIGRVLLFVAAIIIVLIVPYLWVLPIHYIGNYLKQKGKVFDDATFRWTLRHFWIACSIWFFCDVLTVILFDYPVIISWFNDKFTSEGYELISNHYANLTLFFSCVVMLFTFIFLNWEDITRFFLKLRSNTGLIWKGIGIAFLLRFGFGIYYVVLKLFGIDLKVNASGFASVTDSVVSINQFYHPLLGLLIVAIIVPIYEEILFRGVFLSACQRNMTFYAANILQAIAFASLHDDYRLLPFYIAFAMAGGYFTRKTGSLITSVSMHMTNNLLVFIGIVFTH
ncbi:MAG TPA: type II CAAX endopeptidase family protein [Cyclobacteriaceae bacterium]|nr:type II CAAX endopeptidase family protein [Cyclobacteriaceae bacterium]